MARVEDCTLEAVKLLRGELCDAVGERVFFEYNPGNHFADPEGRMEKAFRWLLREA